MTAPPAFGNRELDALWPYIERTLDRMANVVAGCTVAERNWRPPAPGANTIEALATHTLANARVNILQVLCGRPLERDRDAEFRAEATPSSTYPWPEVRRELRDALSALPPDAMDRRVVHPVRGEVSGREVIIILARHAAEHVGHAELTRDLARAALSEPAG